MIKVVHILPCLNYGGTERSVLNLCKFSKTTESTVVSLLQGQMEEEFQKEGIPIFVLENIKNSYERYRKALEVLKKADIIHMNWLYFDWCQLWLTQQMKVPYIITLRWRYRLPLLDCVICCVAQNLRAIQDERNRCVVILNGVDLTRFTHKQRAKKKTDKIIMTSISRPDKCAPYFWLAMKNVLEANPNVELWIVGGKPWTAKQIKSLGIRRDIPDILAQTDIFVYTPYPAVGAFDNVVLEAMAMGVPCVVSDVECVNEAVTHGKEGLLLPYGDQETLVGALNSLIENEEYRIQLGQNALEKAKKFDIANVVQKYHELYSSIINLK